MHPAASIILFTTAAGAGYGLLFLAGLGAAFGLLPEARWLGLVLLGLALGMISLGLASSTFHLGHPERAWRALSQWRSSWLSREGVAALVTFLPAGLFAIGWVFLEETGGLWALLGLLAAAGAMVTVYCTAMIYASLKPIRQWHHPLTAPLYLLFALASGALLLNAVLPLFGVSAAGWSALLVLLSLVIAWGVKLIYWRRVDGGRSASTPETATGLTGRGQVRLLDTPHTGENYLLREMGYQIARKHAAKLRRLALTFGFALPFAFTLFAFFAGGWPAATLSLLAALSGLTGIVLERWLFFAEATHSVTLYYGAREV
ncbi:MAG: dimethyl sulfoxide reductase anchor subunit family protein [Kiloniellales bacterium]